MQVASCESQLQTFGMTGAIDLTSPATVNVRIPAAPGWTHETALKWRDEVQSAIRCELSLDEDLGNGLHRVAVFTFTNLDDAAAFIDALGLVLSR